MGTTLVHLVFPLIISLVGVFILLRAVKRQRKRDPADVLEKIQETQYQRSRLTKQAQAAKPVERYEDERLAKLGFNSLRNHIEDEIDPALSAKRVRSPSPSSLPETLEPSREDDPPEIVMLHIMAKNGKQFVGYELLQAILACGFRFGEMDIFHRHQKANGHGKVLFSLASALEPGTFDMNAMGGYACAGLTLFMQTEKMKDAIAVFDLMLNTAQELADDLNGILMDEKRKPLQPGKITDIRESLRDLSNDAGQAQLDFSLGN